MSVNYEPDGDVLIPEEMSERFEREAKELRERAMSKPPKPPLWKRALKVIAALCFGFLGGALAFVLLIALERSGN